MTITPSLTLLSATLLVSCLSAQQQPGEAPAADKAQPGSVNVFLNEPEQPRRLMTPLYRAAKDGKTREVRALLAAGADPRATSSDHFAMPDEEIPPESVHSGLSPLHVAANAEIVRALAAAGADLNARMDEGLTPLDTAKNAEIARALLAAGASTPGRQALSYQITMGGSAELIRLLIKAGAPVTEGDGGAGWSILLAAGSDCDGEVARELIRAGADINARDKEGNTPLILAAGWQDFRKYFMGRPGNTEVLRELIKAGADVNMPNNKGRTPLHEAAHLENPDNLAALLAAGAKVDARDTAGRTPLHDAAAANMVDTAEIVRRLLLAGADPNAKDKQGATPAQLVEENIEMDAEVKAKIYKHLRDAGARNVPDPASIPSGEGGSGASPSDEDAPGDA